MLNTGPQWLLPKLRQLDATTPPPPSPPRPLPRAKQDSGAPADRAEQPAGTGPGPRKPWAARSATHWTRRRSDQALTAGPAATSARPSQTPGRWIHRQFHGAHGAREYNVYLPSGLVPSRRVPVVLLLHGCSQRPVDFAQESGFVAVADAERFLVVAPRQEQHHQLQRCWRWYEAEHQARGRGEPAMLAELVGEVVAEEELWRADRRRVYAAGLSAGGAMSLILATTYPDVIAAAGVHSATAYRSATQGFSALSAMSAHATMPAHELIGGEMAPVVLVQGTNDPVVRAPNGDRIVDQWLASRDAAALTGLDRVRPLATTRALVVDGRRCIRTRWYTARGRRVLEYWRVDGLRHAWSGGQRKGSFVDPKGPRAAEVMTSFFQRHKLPPGPARPGATAAPTKPPTEPPDARGVQTRERPDRPPMIWFDDAD